MIQSIQDERAAAAKEQEDREAELARQEEEYRAAQEAERKILQEERLARDAADAARRAAIVQAALERKAKQDALRQEAMRRKELRRQTAQEKQKAAELARQQRAEEKRMELKAGRLAMGEKKKAAAELRRLEIQKSKELIEAKRLETQSKTREQATTATFKVGIAMATTNNSAAQTNPSKGGRSVDVLSMQKLDSVKSVAEVERAATAEEARRNEGMKLTEQASQHRREEVERRSRQGPPASALARILAREYGLDINTIRPTRGRITADDVRNAVPPDETTPIDKTVDFFFADPATEIEDDGRF